MKNRPRKPILPERIKDHPIGRPVWDGLVFLCALFIIAFRFEIVGTLVFLGIIGAILIISDRLSDIFLPLILLTVFVTRMYDSFETFIPFIWYYVFIASCAIFHIVYYWAKPRLGYSFWGIAAVSIAVTAGGLFTLSAKEYFKPFTLYYVGGLGIMMIVIYLLSEPRADEKARDRFLLGLFLAGVLSVFAVGRFYLEGWESLVEQHRIPEFQSSNNLSTFLMLSLPVGFYYARRIKALAFFPMIQYAAILLCVSRAGILFGSLEFFFLLFFFSFYKSDWFRRIVYIGVAILIICVLVYYSKDIVRLLLKSYKIRKIDGFEELSKTEILKIVWAQFVGTKEIRITLLTRSFSDFLTNPVFGVGLGYTGNADIYSPKTGAMNWYHMWGPQIWGSMGTVGILAYGFQLFRRIRLAFARRGFPEVTLSLCYLGLFLMTLVNPGEFCPIPYGVIATAIFVFLEPRTRAEAGRARFLVRGMKKEKKETSAGENGRPANVTEARNT